MKKFGALLLALSLSAVTMAQDKAQEKTSLTSKFAQKGILNHLDLGVNVGTVGIGVDVAVPVGKYVRVRAGYNYMPRFTLHSNFSIETSKGSFGQSAIQYFDKYKNKIASKLEQPPFDQPEYQKYKDLFGKLYDMGVHDYVTMGLQPNLHQFKFLVDVMPFKNNKHWSFTAGFFVGSSNVGSACNLEKETALLEGVRFYNDLYLEICSETFPATSLTIPGTDVDVLQKMKDAGVAGFPIGYFANGNKAMMVPGEDGTARAEMKISKVRPYLGFGYNTHLSRNKKWNLNVDAGVLFLCGKPKVYVDNVYSIDENRPSEVYEYTYGFPLAHPNYDIVHYNLDYDYSSDDESQQIWLVDQPLQHVDLMRDLHDIPGKVGDMVNTISKFKVYPNLSVTVSYRLY